MHFDVKSVFSHTIITSIIDGIDSEEIVNKLKTENYEKCTYDGCYGTESFNVLSKFPKLKEKIYSSFNYVLGDIYEFSGNYNFEITTSWATKVEPGCFSQVHNHCNCWFSAVYYPKKVFGGIEFYNPYDIPFTISSSPLISKSFSYEAEEDNSLIIFPSYLKHKVKKNTSRDDRYSIALNIIPTGTYGHGDSTITNLSL